MWPAYFDANKTRKEGRRVSKNLAVSSPKITEIQAAAERLGLKPQAVFDKNFPKTPWAKTGMLLVEKQTPKEQVINKLAKQLQKIRSDSQQQVQK
ncbi:MAG: signal recognition particle protein Srp19 [Candidatus Bathyarchaeota archaeon]|nr:signal recognition particle protein Srp19 [Candidatus Bathyarchaeota archaeon]